MFCKRGVLRNFPKFTGKHLRQRLFFNKVADLKPARLLKKRLWHRCFSLSFAKYLRTTFVTEHLVATSTVPRETWRTLAQAMSNRNFYTSKVTKHLFSWNKFLTNLFVIERVISIFIPYSFLQFTSFCKKNEIFGIFYQAKLQTRRSAWEEYASFHSHKKRKDSLETRAVFSWILILAWSFRGSQSGSVSTLASASWFWCYQNYNWLFCMLHNDDIISTSVSETVEKIPTDGKDDRNCSFMCFTLHSHSSYKE